jgi:hypothetical protein
VERSLPWNWYADPGVLRLEGERIFARAWQYVGHTGQVAEVGFFAATAGPTPVVVTQARSTTSSRRTSTKPGWTSWWRSTPTSGWNQALVEGVQRGVCSGVLAEGRLLSESERLVAHFQRLCATALAS